MKLITKYFDIFIILLISVTTFWVIINTEARSDYGDGAMHYVLAKYSFQYPKFYLDHWAKPIFTLIASPFAQFGMLGCCILNLICNTISSFLIYLLAKQFNLKYSWIVALIIFLSPEAFRTSNSALTEPLFSVILLSAFYFLVVAKFNFSAIVISFLPFARTEGFFIMGIFAIAFLYKKQWKSILLLPVVTVIYSIIGGLYFQDFLWLITENPYQGASDIYGHGELLDFVSSYHTTFGNYTSYGLLISLGLFIITLFKFKKFPLLFPFGFSFFIIFFFVGLHSILWWKGLAGSLGLLRVLTCITPLIAFCVLIGYNLLNNFHHKLYLVSSVLIMLHASDIFENANKILPFSFGVEEGVMQTSADWYLQNVSSDKKISYYYPYFTLALKTDPFDEKKVLNSGGLDKEHPENTLKSGEIIFWDSHFFPKEIGQPLERFLDNKEFLLLNNFSSSYPNPKFEVYIFQRK